jgi:hypothetical protein
MGRGSLGHLCWAFSLALALPKGPSLNCGVSGAAGQEPAVGGWPLVVAGGLGLCQSRMGVASISVLWQGCSFKDL